MSTAENGFKEYCIWPYDRSVVSESDVVDITQVEREPNIKVLTTKTRTSNIELASTTEPFLNSQNLSPSIFK